MSVKEYAIIVAGGKGTRMNSALPKQFLPLLDKPVIFHTLEVFFDYSKDINLILVLPEDDIPTWETLVHKYQFAIQVSVVAGGASRFQSVKNGLTHIGEEQGLVAIHDGVRPLVSKDIIGASFRLAAVHQSAIASVRLKESIRVVDQDTTKAMDRSKFRMMQTPQTFDLALIKKAYNIKEEDNLTDDASVLEQAGHKISLFEGSYSNLKITTPEDLIIAEAILKDSKK